MFNEGTLLDAMKNAGVGTPATRSSIIETLYKRKCIIEEKNNLLPTKKGIQIINLLQRINNPLVDIEYTVVLESQLRELENGEDFDIVMNTIKSLYTSIIDSVNTCTEALDNGQTFALSVE